MPTFGKSPVIPSMRYQNAPAAIDWLGRVLGFSKHLVVPGDGDKILHAQLSLGEGMIMLGSERDGHARAIDGRTWTWGSEYPVRLPRGGRSGSLA